VEQQQECVTRQRNTCQCKAKHMSGGWGADLAAVWMRVPLKGSLSEITVLLTSKSSSSSSGSPAFLPRMVFTTLLTPAAADSAGAIIFITSSRVLRLTV